MKSTLALATGIMLMLITPASAFELTRKFFGGESYQKVDDFSKLKETKSEGTGPQPPRPPQAPKTPPKETVPDAGATLALALMGFGALAVGAKKLKK